MVKFKYKMLGFAKKIIPYILVLLIFAGAGFLGGAERARAESPTDPGTCTVTDISQRPYQIIPNNTKTRGECTALAIRGVTTAIFVPGDGSGAVVPKDTDPVRNKSLFEDKIDNGCTNIISTFKGCVLGTLYWLWHDVPAFYLAIVGWFFNVMMKITLDSDLFKQGFVSDGWAIVRDLSNIFFILVLLYIAIKIILGLGGHDVKKMIATVIVVALLINFSMFFTGIIIDTSNILALIFYNKLKVSTEVKLPDGTTAERPYARINGEKDISGGLVAAFDPTRAVGQDFFDEAQKSFAPDGTPIPGSNDLPFGIMLGAILIAGLLMGFAAFALFVSAFAFVSRLIELWILIIASPFAFMSSIVPQMSGIPDWGWTAWLKRLLKAAFMAPAFMFFLYFIFLLIKTNIFKTMLGSPAVGENDPAGMVKILLGIILPTLLICILLLKSVKLAKAGSGQFGESIVKWGSALGGMATGLAVGAATGGASMLGRASLGRAGAAVANSQWANRLESRGGNFATRFIGARTRDLGKIASTGSFDIRGVKIAGKDLGGATGLNMGKAKEGGWVQMRKQQVEKRQKRAKDLEVHEDEPLKQALNRAEMDFQELLNFLHNDFTRIDRDLERQRKRKSDAARGSAEEAAANAEIARLRADKRTLAQTTIVATGPNAGRTMEEMEDIVIPEAKNEIHHEDVERKRGLAENIQSPISRALNFIVTGGTYSWHRGVNEAAHKIIMEAKLDSGEKTH